MSKFAAEIDKLLKHVEQEGFERGWKAARDALAESLAQPRVAGGVSSSPLKKTAAKRVKRGHKRRKAISPGATIEQQVEDFIGANPGKTGVEIIRGLEPANSKTIRTMLRRLRLARKIEKRDDGGWFKA
jgi:hypothetical protein